jgi:hypothetical protein
MQTFTTKASAIAYATQMSWTGADAERAFAGLKAPVNEITWLNAMAQFAGAELASRQNLQAAQKGQVTKKTAYIQQKELEHADSIRKFQEEVQEERSRWLGLIRVMYSIASRFGMKDPMIDHILKTYDAA